MPAPVGLESADGGDGNGLMVHGRADADLVAHGEATRIADVDVGDAGGSARKEIGMVRRSADARDRDGLDAMPDALDVEPDLVTDRDVFGGGHLQVGGAGGRVHGQVGLRAGFSNGGDSGHLVLFLCACDSGISSAVADGDLLANHEPGRAHDGHIGGAGRDGDDGAVRERLPESRTVAGGRSHLDDLSSLHAGASVDADRVAGGHADRAPDVDGGIAGARANSQSGVGEAKQVKAAGRELCSVRDRHWGEDGRLSGALGERPVGDVDLFGARVVELDERVGGVWTGTDAEFVDIDRTDVAHFPGDCLGLRAAVRLVCPGGDREQVAVEGRRSRSHLESRAHAGARRDRLCKCLGRLGAARNDRSTG